LTATAAATAAPRVIAISASAEEMTAQVEELTASTHALGSMAQELRTEVAAFQLRPAPANVVTIDVARQAHAA